VLLILGVLAMLARPLLRRTSYETRDSTIVVMADESLSMGIVDRYSNRDVPEAIGDLLDMSPETVESTSRYDLLRDYLFADENLKLIESLQRKGKVVVSTFSSSPVEQVRLPKLKEGESPPPVDGTNSAAEILPSYDTIRAETRAQETRIGDSVSAAVTSIIGSGFGDEDERVSGVLLFTDGQENAGSAAIAEVARRLGERGTPIHVVGTGNPDEPKDIRLVNMDVDEVVLVGDEVSFDISIIADGFEGESRPLRLNLDGVSVDSKNVTLEGGGKKQLERLVYVPRKAGEITVTAEIEGLGGEVFYENNSITKTIRVLDEKVRVLYLEYKPSWEYRFLKGILVRDPTVEAQVWLYDADPEFIQESSRGVPPLKRPPVSKQELSRFHVVILGDVDPRELGPELAGGLKEFVYDGGGVIFLSGRHNNPYRYRDTELYAIFPTEIVDVPLARRMEPVTESWHVELTPEGAELPLMRLDNDPAKNRALWEGKDSLGLPPFFRYSMVGKAKNSTVVLARHPEERIPNTRRRRVILGYMNYGKGRSFFSAVDNFWRWRAGVDNLYTSRFWGQVIRYVAAGRFLGQTPQISIATDKAVYKIGESVKVDARVFDKNMKPLSDRNVTLYHAAPGREDEVPQAVELTLNELKGAGSYEGALTGSTRGLHTLWYGSETDRRVVRTFTVEIPALETRDPRLNLALLQRVARESGGTYHGLADVKLAIDAIRGVSRSQQGLVETDDLWDDSWVLLLLVALLALEWILRKWVRLL
ncbi:MAG: vWA domain-containing protein, partial [Planctomycetota bacterium]